MYSKQEIAYLLKSGFSLSEIMATDGVTPEPQPEPTPAPQPQDNSSAVLAAIENLTKTIQAGNIRAVGFPSPDPQQTAENILANIINPPGYTGKKE